jgi:hypothetical protein
MLPCRLAGLAAAAMEGLEMDLDPLETRWRPAINQG